MKYLIKRILTQLLAGGHLRLIITRARKEAYRLYDSQGIIQEQFKARTIEGIKKNLPHSIFKKDKYGRITLRRRQVQQLHGNFLVKRIYKDLIKAK